MHDKFTDALTSVLSVALAAGVMAFAAYKVITLQGMENPPVNMGLNFPPPRPKVIMDDLAAVDPLTTQSLGPASATQPVEREKPPVSPPGFSLLTVVDGVAFVEIALARGRTLVPVSVGTVLPGGYRVDAIEQRNGRWALHTGTFVIEQDVPPPQ